VRAARAIEIVDAWEADARSCPPALRILSETSRGFGDGRALLEGQIALSAAGRMCMKGHSHYVAEARDGRSSSIDGLTASAGRPRFAGPMCSVQRPADAQFESVSPAGDPRPSTLSAWLESACVIERRRCDMSSRHSVAHPLAKRTTNDQAKTIETSEAVPVRKAMMESVKSDL
jgi:hypothetical protein